MLISALLQLQVSLKIKDLEVFKIIIEFTLNPKLSALKVQSLTELENWIVPFRWSPKCAIEGFLRAFRHKVRAFE